MKLELNHIAKSFGEKVVLTDLCLKVESGRALGLLGRNGAGKTTTIRIVMDVFPPDGGEVLFDGRPKAKSPVTIGYLPEERGLYPKKLIGEQLIYFGKLRGMRAADAKTAAQRILTSLGMEDTFTKRLDVLSKGNQQKIQLAATLLCDPDVVILDEPFSGLDPVNAQLLKEMVRELINRGKIVLFSSHQMNYVEEFCDDIAILREGQIVLSGNIRQIKRCYERNKIIVKAPLEEAAKIDAFIKAECAGIVKSTGANADGLLVTVAEARATHELMKAIAASELPFDGIYVSEPTLNDIFVEYTEAAV